MSWSIGASQYGGVDIGGSQRDAPVITYVPIAASGGGVGGGTADLSILHTAPMAASGGGVGGGTATLRVIFAHPHHPVELHTISLGAQTWLLCNSVDTVNGFTPEAVTRGEIKNGEDALEVTLPASHVFPQLYVNSAPGKNAIYTIQWLDRDDNPGSLRVIYKGVVKSVSFLEDGETASVHLESIVATFDKEVPVRSFSPQCQHFLYDEGCTIDKDEPDPVTPGEYLYRFDGQVTVVSGNTINVSGISAKGATWALPGYVAFGTDDYRQILAQVGDLLTLILPFTTDLTGETVTVYAGCDHSTTMCDAKFDNVDNYDGCPYVPTKNIFRTGIK